jgi:hypothetical protein
MIYIVNYVKDNGFFKAAKHKPELKSVNREGEIVSETVYKRPSVPGGKRNYVPSINYSSQRVRIDLKQSDLNKLVSEIELYDSSGAKITTAPIANSSAPFWTHKEINLLLESASHSLDDERPIDRFWLACMRADPDFYFKDGKGVNTTVHAKIKYEVTPINMKENEGQEKAAESMKAVELLDAMSSETKGRILKGLGVYIGGKTDPTLIHKTLFSKITFEKDDIIRGSNERNIDRFLVLAKSSTQALTIIEIIADAKRKGAIYKDKNGNFKYGDIPLGRSEAEVRNFLEDHDNNDILLGITETVNKKE